MSATISPNICWGEWGHFYFYFSGGGKFLMYFYPLLPTERQQGDNVGDMSRCRVPCLTPCRERCYISASDLHEGTAHLCPATAPYCSLQHPRLTPNSSGRVPGSRQHRCVMAEQENETWPEYSVAGSASEAVTLCSSCQPLKPRNMGKENQSPSAPRILDL